MFEKIIIKGFQKHKRISIDFDPQITVLVGKSDVGKSAVLRSLRWLCLNKSPKRHINWDLERATVILYIDGHKIIRKQGAGINLYSLDGKPLKAFNRGVPDEIAELLNVDNSNFQRQHDPAFWISLPSPQLTKELNAIVDLSIIDRSLSKVGILVRKTKSEVELTKERLKESKRNRLELLWVTDATKEFKHLESLQERLETAQYAANTVESLVTDIQNIIRSQGIVAELLEEAEPLLKRYEELLELDSRINLLEVNIVDIESLEAQICQTKEKIEKIEKQLAKIKKCPVCQRPMSLT